MIRQQARHGRQRSGQIAYDRTATRRRRSETCGAGSRGTILPPKMPGCWASIVTNSVVWFTAARSRRAMAARTRSKSTATPARFTDPVTRALESCMKAKFAQDSGLPEATLFIGGAGLDPDAVTCVVGETPYKVSRGPRPRWFWTSSGHIQSADPDDHLRAVLALAEAFSLRHGEFPPVEIRASLFLPDDGPTFYSRALVRALRRFGSVTLNLSSEREPVVLPHDAGPRTDVAEQKALSV